MSSFSNSRIATSLMGFRAPTTRSVELTAIQGRPCHLRRTEGISPR